MPSFEKIIGIIVFTITLTIASGRNDLVIKAIFEIRKVALYKAKKPWGNPSIFKTQFN